MPEYRVVWLSRSHLSRPRAPHSGVGSSAALNSQVDRQSGHRLSLCDDSHLLIHCRWNACEHTPKHTGDSSPGNRQSGALHSNAFLQMPQQSSFSPAFHVQYATDFHVFIRTYMRNERHSRVSAPGHALCFARKTWNEDRNQTFPSDLVSVFVPTQRDSETKPGYERTLKFEESSIDIYKCCHFMPNAPSRAVTLAVALGLPDFPASEERRRTYGAGDTSCARRSFLL